MHTLNFVLLVLGFICFIIATFTDGGWPRTVPTNGRAINLVALGLAFWILVALIAELKVVTG